MDSRKIKLDPTTVSAHGNKAEWLDTMVHGHTWLEHLVLMQGVRASHPQRTLG